MSSLITPLSGKESTDNGSDSGKEDHALSPDHYPILHNLPRKLFVICLFIGIGTLGTFDHNRKLQVAVSDGASTRAFSSPEFLRAGASNSATGEIFSNKKIRSFNGQRVITNDDHESIKLLTKPCERWGVVTTIFDPTEAITRVANMPSWCLVIVPDLKTPEDYMDKLSTLQSNGKGDISLDNVFYFSIEKQREWEHIEGPFGKFVRTTPWKHFCRKNIGYLFTILHGAKYIFDFDDDNFVKVDLNGSPLQLLPEELDSDDGLILKGVNVIMQGSNAFNHHPIMGASVNDSWARGFPIELIQDVHTQGNIAFETDLAFATAKKEIGVIQFLADGNPDIDAMHRISKPLPMTFPLDNSKSVLVPTHSYAPYNAQATIHTKNALWATLLPGSVPGRVSDIWRSYFAQCIFHDTGIQLVFSPPKILQERNEHNYLGDFNAEQDLYSKSGKLIEFLSEWDSVDDTVPKRMEKLWIDLYEHGYIEINDVHAVQAWIGALNQVGYKFPQLKRRFRNVVVMGQFNYADSPTIVDDVTFWTQKHREHFTTVVATGPFTDGDMNAFRERSIEARSHHSILEERRSESGHRGGSQKGFYAPLENHMNTLLEFRDSPVIEGVLYTHDDSLLNFTEISRNGYPFPSEDIIASDNRGGSVAFQDPRTHPNPDLVNRYAYRIYPDGHLEDFKKSASFETIDALVQTTLGRAWPHTPFSFCGGGQIEMAKDIELSKHYLEADGSLLISPYVQADFLYMPTKFTDEFAAAAQFHLKHSVFIECAYGTVVDMVRHRTGANVRITKLCTTFDQSMRGTPEFVDNCRTTQTNLAVTHPFKLSRGYEMYSDAMDSSQ